MSVCLVPIVSAYRMHKVCMCDEYIIYGVCGVVGRSAKSCRRCSLPRAQVCLAIHVLPPHTREEII
jgi:hypothetical protein